MTIEDAKYFEKNEVVQLRIVKAGEEGMGITEYRGVKDFYRMIKEVGLKKSDGTYLLERYFTHEEEVKCNGNPVMLNAAIYLLISKAQNDNLFMGVKPKITRDMIESKVMELEK